MTHSHIDVVREAPQKIPAEFTAESASELAEAMRRLARNIESRTRFVDEYIPQTSVVANNLGVTLQPQFELFYERIHRVIVTGPPVATLGGQSSGTVSNPSAAGVVISGNVLVPPGEYNAYWQVGLEGTVTAADADNMRISQGSNVLLSARYPGVVGEYPQPVVQLVSDGVTNVRITTAAAASGASAIYNASLSLVPVNVSVPFTLQLGDRVWNLVLPLTGLLEFSAGILLSRTDTRKLISTISGPWSLELTGEADVRNRE